MRRPGGPLQFLFGVVGGWIVLRALTFASPVLLQAAFPDGAPLPAMLGSISTGSEAVGAADANPMVQQSLRPLPVLAPQAEMKRALVPASVLPRPDYAKRAVESGLVPIGGLREKTASVPVNRTAPSSPAPPAAEPVATRAPAMTAPSIAPQARAKRASPWSVTGWMLWRPNVMGGLAQGPLLGGSQAGVRIDYRLWGDGQRGLALYGRGTRAIERPFAEEAAMGVAVRPVRGLPVSIMAERRQRLGRGGRNGFALLAAGGIGPRPIARRIEVEGYAQGGVVGLPGADGFADGKASLTYKLTRPGRQPDVALGMSLSGSVQPGASRVDIGPEVRVRLPVVGGHMRLSAEWRERIAGDARPSRGPAITLVADF